MRNIYKTLLLASFLLMGGMSFAQNTTCNASFRWSNSSFQIRGVSTTGALTNINFTNSVFGNTQDYTASQVIQATKGSSFNITVQSSWYTGVWVDWDRNGSYNNTNERIDYWGTGSSAANTRNITLNVPSTASGLYRMRVIQGGTSGFSTPCGFINYGDAEDYALDILAYNNSATFAEIISPRNPLCGTVSRVEVRLRNVGLLDLTSLDIGGVVQSVQFGTIPLTTANWTGTIPGTSEDTSTYVPFTYSAGFQIGDTLTIWTANPNGFTDTLSSDDTVRIVMGTGVSGVFTVGDTTGGANDFASLNEAVQYLDSVGAVCDTTYIYLEDSIIWNEQITLSPLLNMSEMAPVIFATQPGASGKATITHDHTGTGDNYTVQFGNGAEHYIFDNLNIYSGVGSFSAFGAVILTGANSAYNTVSNCNLKSNLNINTTSYDNSVITSRSGNLIELGSHHNDFINNIIENGSFACYMYDAGYFNRYEGNTIKNPYYMGFYSWETEGPEFVNNTMISNSIYAFGYGYYIYYCEDDPFTLENNIIHPERDEWPRYGMYIFGSTAKANNRNIVRNNSISVGQAWSGNLTYGLYMGQTGFTDITNNSIAVRGTNFDSYGMLLDGAGAMRVHNNSIAHFGSGTAVRYNGNSTVISSENNNIYSTGFILASYNGFGYTNFADWQNRAGYDASSVSVDPAYYEIGSAVSGLSDLHVCNSALDGTADPIFAPMYDLDGDMRDANNPDIGIDEFVGLATLTLGDDIKYCPGNSVTLSTPGNLTGNTVIWSNGSTDESITVSTPGSYSFILRNSCGIAQDTVEISYPEVVNLSSNDTLICDGDMITVAANLSSASYNWNNGETGSSISIDDEGEYIVNAVDQYGCPSADTIEVMISESANLNTQASDTVLCPGQFLSLETGVDPRTGVVYTWTGFLDNSTKATNNILLGWNEAATLVVEVDDNSCISYDTLVIDNSPAPVAQFVANRIDGRTFAFVPDSMHSRFQYDWDFGDRTTSTQAAPTKLYQVHGQYNVVLRVTTLCGTATEQNDAETFAIGITEELANKLVSVYPNPSAGIVNVDLESSENVQLEVSDINGKVVFAKELGTVVGNTNEQIDLTNLASGVYTLRVQLNDATVVRKLTIE